MHVPHAGDRAYGVEFAVPAAPAVEVVKTCGAGWCRSLTAIRCGSPTSTPDAATGEIERRDEASDLGGTMRLGLQEQRVKPGTRSHALYGKDVVGERHRHRYEFNNRYRSQLEDAGLVISAKSMDDLLVEMVELPGHPWFIACQAHPEFLSTPRDGHPLFIGFIRAAREHKAGGRLLKEAQA